ncbi:MAG: HAMP domain-containing histidine kinase [Chloroflexi bacterium]|nr:HAMP domain-containing histidine kinase [Chloroflexota bacterium]
MTSITATNDVHPALRSDPQSVVRVIQWTLPLMLFAIVALYEGWEHVIVKGQSLTDIHLTGEVFFFGVLGPAAVFGALTYIRRLLAIQWSARVELERLNHELESRVAERTAVLEQRNGELARANFELQQLDQMKSDFVALVSHELRAPLTALNGGLELALQQTDSLPPAARRTLEVMMHESDRLTRFVQTILDLSRMEAGKLILTFGPVAAMPLLQHAVEIVMPDNRRSIHWDVPRNLPPLWADETYLEEIFRNLLRNADKYSPPDQPIHIAASVTGHCIELRVTDHGPGIPAEMQEHIFEQFYRGHRGENAPPGWGLGLHIARKLAEAQNGALRLHSPAHGNGAPGATFIVSVPVAESPDETSDG